MELGSLYLYPLKSCAPWAVATADVRPRGLAHDRRWLLVDDAGRFLTGREWPRLTLVRATPEADGLALRAPGMPGLRVPVPTAPANVPVTIWKDTVEARPCGDAADAWFTRFLGHPARLVHMDDGVRRPLADKHGHPGGEVSFADTAPLLVITRAALDALNTRLPVPVPIERFRPNLVVDGAPAHAEDGWSRVRIGDVEFDATTPCARCVFTTVDLATGQRDASGEPLRTLATYRRAEKGVTFGRYLVPRGTGTLRIGDPVAVLA